MGESIEKYSVSVSVWIMVSVIVFLLVLWFQWWSLVFWAESKILENRNKIINLEEKYEALQKYLYVMKSDLKEEIDKNNIKIDQVINILLKK